VVAGRASRQNCSHAPVRGPTLIPL